MPSKTIARPLPPVEYLHECFHCDLESGVLTWRARPRSHFANEGSHHRFLSCSAGRRAGGLTADGYLHVFLDGTHYLSHRIVWAMVTGREPDTGLQIDHVDMCRTNNRPSNLELVTKQDNLLRQTRYKNNLSGVTGVYYYPRIARWVASIGVSGKQISLGTFNLLEDAAAARREAEALYGYAHNHGAEKVVADTALFECDKIESSPWLTGCHRIKKTGRWRARITIDRKRIHIGCYDTLEQAVAAYKDAERQHAVVSCAGVVK